MLEFFQIIRIRAADYPPLRDLSRRIATLLEPEVSAPSEWAACLDDLLGAVYSLFYAIHYDFSERPNALAPENIKSVLDRAKDMAQNRVRTEGKWTAGFYFNNALFRIAAVTHRALKMYLPNSKLNMETLVSEAETKYRNATGRDWEHGSLKTVCDEVNHLKHTDAGIIKGRAAVLQTAIKAAEELLALIEACESADISVIRVFSLWEPRGSKAFR